MSGIQVAQTGSRWRRRVRVTAMLVAVIGASTWGTADAATGGNFLLGDSNSADQTTSLTSSSGTPLALNAPAGVPPLAVNSSTMVPLLNAHAVGGLTAGQLQRKVAGSCGNGIASIASSGTASCASDTRVFTSTGLFTVPAGIGYVKAEIWAAGGGGDHGGAHFYGTDGGGGGFESVLFRVDAGQKYVINVGLGGTAGTSTVSPTAGQESSLAHSGQPPFAGAAGGTAGLSSGVPATCNSVGGSPDQLGAAVIGEAFAIGTSGTCNSGGSTVEANFAGAGGAGGALSNVDGVLPPGSPGHDGLVVLTLSP